MASGPVAAAMANAVELLNGMNEVAGDAEVATRAVVMSSKGSGTTRAVTACRVGDVLDTQRRRRNGLQEQYSEGNLS